MAFDGVLIGSVATLELQTSTSLLTLEAHSTPDLTQRLPTKSTGKSKAKASMDNRGSHHQKWLLFANVKHDLHKRDAPDPVRCCISQRCRHFAINQIHFLVDEINYLSHAECLKIVADYRSCLERALEINLDRARHITEDQEQFDYMKTAIPNILRGVKHVTAQRRYYNQTVSNIFGAYLGVYCQI